jgi:hypothetical protein
MSKEKRKKQNRTGNRKQETGNRKQETGNRKQETGNRKQETGNRKQLTGNRKSYSLSSISFAPPFKLIELHSHNLTKQAQAVSYYGNVHKSESSSSLLRALLTRVDPS